VRRTLDRSAPISLSYYSIAADRLGLANCRRCREPLDLHQPIASQPDQFLATCPECGVWYRVEVSPGEGRAFVVQLPEVADVRPLDPPSKRSKSPEPPHP